MKTAYNRLAIFLVSALTLAVHAGTSYAQEYDNTPVTISKDKVRVNGKICWSHIVLERQTLFSISKAYNVSIDDILRFNPSVKENGLKKNSIIIIPSEEAIAKSKEAEIIPEPAAKEETEAKTEEVMKEKPVTKEETDIKVEADIKEEVKKTAEIRRDSKRKTHTVKWFEDLDVIAAKYGVSTEALMWINDLTGRKLKSRQKLLIPEPGEFEEAQKSLNEMEDVNQADSLNAVDSTVASEDKENIFKPHILFPKSKVKATLMLPLKSGKGAGSKNNMDFYCGVLLAAYDLGNEGISADINVLDITNGTADLPEDIIEGSDMFIGPISSGDIQRFRSAIGKDKIIISPLDPRVETIAAVDSNLIQIPTPHRIQYNNLVQWLKNDMMPSDKAMIITEKGSRGTDATNVLIAAADSSGVDFTRFSYSILEGRDVMEPLTGLMTETGVNRVLIASESEAFVNDVIRNINLLIYNKLDVVIYGPAKIRNFETIEVENLHNAKLHSSLNYHINYDDPRVQKFLMKYRALYNTEPSQFAFQGYDIANYFIRLCYRLGDRWPEMLEHAGAEMLQSTFRCKRVDSGGFINNGVRKVVYTEGYGVVIQNN